MNDYLIVDNNNRVFEAFGQDNKKDVAEIPAIYLKGITFHYVKNIDEVIDFALL